MKIGINLVGVSYNSGKDGGRYRNYEDAKDGLFNNVVLPLIDKGHSVQFYLCSYDNEKRQDILNTYKPVKWKWENPNCNHIGGGERVGNIKAMSAIYLDSLYNIINEDLDLLISTRFDINFYKNPFDVYDYDFTKCNFLWREPEFTHMPIVNDTFIVLPYSMRGNLYDAIIDMEHGDYECKVGMHNLYVPMCKQVGKENVQWVDDEIKRTVNTDLYKLMRHE